MVLALPSGLFSSCPFVVACPRWLLGPGSGAARGRICGGSHVFCFSANLATACDASFFGVFFLRVAALCVCVQLL